MPLWHALDAWGCGMCSMPTPVTYTHMSCAQPTHQQQARPGRMPRRAPGRGRLSSCSRPPGSAARWRCHATCSSAQRTWRLCRQRSWCSRPRRTCTQAAQYSAYMHAGLVRPHRKVPPCLHVACSRPLLNRLSLDTAHRPPFQASTTGGPHKASLPQQVPPQQAATSAPTCSRSSWPPRVSAAPPCTPRQSWAGPCSP